MVRPVEKPLQAGDQETLGQKSSLNYLRYTIALPYMDTDYVSTSQPIRLWQLDGLSSQQPLGLIGW